MLVDVGWTWSPYFFTHMELVPDRTATALLHIIQVHVAAGSVIHSDQWRAYNTVAALPVVAAHHTVNHSINFVDPTTGVHTQHIEPYWNRAKIKLKRMKGCHNSHLASYLDELMWTEQFGETS